MFVLATITTYPTPATPVGLCGMVALAAPTNDKG